MSLQRCCPVLANANAQMSSDNRALSLKDETFDLEGISDMQSHQHVQFLHAVALRPAVTVYAAVIEGLYVYRGWHVI